MNDLDFQQFIEKVRKKTSIDLSLYKEQQMKRRLTTLRLKRGYGTFREYFEAIDSDSKLFEEFLDRITINVSEFWRNPNRWEVLRDRFIPELLNGTHSLKCWSAACSTGEEPYTLAMILSEKGILSRSRIIATDIDVNALAKAKIGVYPERSIRDVPADYIKRYFTIESNVYRVKDELKKAVTFQQGNLLLDRFDSNYDLIICRNVLIYFTDEAKEQLYRKFAQALKPGGILFVGSTEQIFSPENYGLESADTFFYRKF